jgi:hypothetical protein
MMRIHSVPQVKRNYSRFSFPRLGIERKSEMKTGLCVSLLGVAVVTIAVIALIGYAAGNEALHHWNNSGPPMAINTAVALLLTGLALFAGGMRFIRRW